MSDQLISVVLVQIFGILGFFLKSYMDKRVTKKEVSRRDAVLKERIEGIGATAARSEIKLEYIEKMLSTHIEDNDFLIKYKDVLQNQSNMILANYRNLDDSHRKILSFWAETIERFGLKYYYSSLRKGKKGDLEIFLNSVMNIQIDNLNTFISSNFPKPKQYKHKNLYFNDFINSNQKDNIKNVMSIHNKTQILIMDLINNGLTQEKTILLFETYLKDFFNTYFDKLDIWESLPEPEYADID